MPLPRRSRGIPRDVRAAVPGRLLAAARSSDGSWLVGTRDAFHVVADDGTTSVWPWE